MNKVLIIAYYWPPSGGSGVQRWLKFVKYLPSYEWEPHVFTPENPSFAIQDTSLLKDVPPEAEIIRFPIWEPYDVFFKVSGWFGAGKKSTPTAVVPSKNRSAFQRMSTWARGNFFIPDPRVFWVKPSVRFLSDYIADNGISVVITTGPPHSMHLIGLKLKKRFPHIRWLADFRDPWTEWGMWDSLMVSKLVRKIHKRLERQVLSAADEIITITPFYVRRFEQLSGRNVRLLTNGYDEEDFKTISRRKAENFLIRHVGIVNEKCDPRPLMKAVKDEMLADPEFGKNVRVEFIGEVHPDFRSFVTGDEMLRKVTLFSGNVSHDDLISMYGYSSLLLLILTGYKDAEGFLPGKLFEYLATGIPVLGVGPVEGDAAVLLQETGGGVMVDSQDTKGQRRILQDNYQKWKSSSGSVVKAHVDTRFSRRHLTGQLVELLRVRQDNFNL